MRLNDLYTSELMPKYAEGYTFACKALDEWVSKVHTRADALSTPWTLAGISALTEEELQTAYKLYSVGEYYPYLPREKRDRFLYEQIVHNHTGITLEALVDVLKHLNPASEMTVSFEDTPAYDDDGDLVDSDYLHHYSVNCTLISAPPEFPVNLYHCLRENLRNLMRATAKLDEIDVTIPVETDINAWGICIFGGYVNSQNAAQNLTALRAGSGWHLAQCNAAIIAATDNPNNVYISASILNRTAGVLNPKENVIEILRSVYMSQTSTGVYRATDGAFGIYRLAPTVYEYKQYHREDFT